MTTTTDTIKALRDALTEARAYIVTRRPALSLSHDITVKTYIGMLNTIDAALTADASEDAYDPMDEINNILKVALAVATEKVVDESASGEQPEDYCTGKFAGLRTMLTCILATLDAVKIAPPAARPAPVAATPAPDAWRVRVALDGEPCRSTLQDDEPDAAEMEKLRAVGYQVEITPMVAATTRHPALSRSLLRPAISSADQLPRGCYCKPGQCGAPMPQWCRDAAKRDGANTPDPSQAAARPAPVGAVQAPDARLQRFASWIMINRPELFQDHACARCVPESDILVAGFTCTYHEAVDVVGGKAAAPAVEKMLETNQLDELGQEVARLQTALCFWLPSITDREDEVADRILQDAFLLCGIDGNIPDDFKSAQELGWVTLAAAPAAPIAEVTAPTWKRITAPGQVKVGDKLRFNIGDDKFSETVKQILHPCTAREELIYNKRKNYYVITSNAITNFGSSKNVEFLAAEHAKPEPVFCTCHICDLCTAMMSQPAAEPVEHSPAFNEVEFATMVEKGTKAWGNEPAPRSDAVEHAKLAEGATDREQFITDYRIWATREHDNTHPEMVMSMAESHWGRAAGAMWLAGRKRQAGQQAGAVDGDASCQ